MKVALIGASGFVGTTVLNELLSRGHQVTGIARDLSKISVKNENLELKAGDVTDSEGLTEILKGHDAVVNSFNAGWTNPNLYDDFLAGSKAIQAAVKAAGVKRFFTIGGAGSLFIAPGLQLIDTPEFPADYKAGAGAARDYLNILREEAELDWTFLSPAIEMHQGTSGVRKGHYRTGLENPVFDENNRSVISAEDMAIAIVDELEKPQFIKQRFTVAY
ncbi:NAD(P)H-binding protein [Emticicia sp. CRIBPO]|uniref:NAD(P)-dependent oxidoreductase n=1 Tax=Emticicia sp. CRIBPO TaxID=2683258 RepID=UPI0014133359|nr:NAD(P)-dependent oxidoreductase [Emticicia sp. CRIBPO]NBA88588.1 NAD(P)H-binding protein [Emticicia sp. CRIBPO]